jgi:hypothetical protein
LDAIGQNHYSFFQVIDTEPGQFLHVKNLLTQELLTIHESAASHMMAPGHIFLGRPVPFDNRTILVGILPFSFPPSAIQDILKFRDWAETETGSSPLTQADLLEIERDIFGVYEDCLDQVQKSLSPTLVNTDNELMVPTTVLFELKTTAQEAFEALYTLDTFETREELLKEAVYDKQHQLKHISFRWTRQGNTMHPEWNNTALGTLTLDKKRLTVDCNSMERAERIRDIVLDRLGNAVLFKKLQATKPLTRKEQEKADQEQSELMAGPEVQAQLAKIQNKIWQEWPSMEIPALNGMTPLAAARDPRGRELLESLLLDFERQNLNLAQGMLPVDINKLRETLGMLKANTVRH